MAPADDSVSARLTRFTFSPLRRAGDEARVGAWALRVADTDGRRILRILVARPA